MSSTQKFTVRIILFHRQFCSYITSNSCRRLKAISSTIVRRGMRSWAPAHATPTHCVWSNPHLFPSLVTGYQNTRKRFRLQIHNDGKSRESTYGPYMHAKSFFPCYYIFMYLSFQFICIYSILQSGPATSSENYHAGWQVRMFLTPRCMIHVSDQISKLKIGKAQRTVMLQNREAAQSWKGEFEKSRYR